MSPETRAALDALPPEDRERIRAHLRRQRQRPRPGDSSAGLPGWMDGTDNEYGLTGEHHDWPPLVGWGRRTPRGYVPIPDGYVVHASRTNIIPSE